MNSPPLKAPFPWFGGKSRAAGLIWSYLGETPNYIEPFAGSLAVLLRRPWAPARYETVNDKDAFIANFWRAVHAVPEAVAEYADHPVNEVDLTARHRWLCDAERKAAFLERMVCDPGYYCAKTAGWWAWGLSCWIGAGWCEGRWYGLGDDRNRGRGMHSGTKRPCTHFQGGVDRRSLVPAHKRPHIHRPKGVQKVSLRAATPEPMAQTSCGIAGVRPDIAAGAKGVHGQRPHLSRSQGVSVKRPHLHNDQGATLRNVALIEWFRALSCRLRYVRVCCGDWKRIMGKAVRAAASPCAILLDPPYSADAGRSACIYREEDLSVAHECREWCKEHGGDPSLRIALCGYEGEGHEELEELGWTVEAWKASGGYGRIHGEKRGTSLVNRHRERIWFSPHCINPRALDMPLFGDLDIT